MKESTAPRVHASPVQVHEEVAQQHTEMQEQPAQEEVQSSTRQPEVMAGKDKSSEAPTMRPMMAQASSSHVHDFDMQAWTEGLSRHVKNIQEAYTSQTKQKDLAEAKISTLKAQLIKAGEQNEEQARIMEELHIARMTEMQETKVGKKRMRP